MSDAVLALVSALAGAAVAGGFSLAGTWSSNRATKEREAARFAHEERATAEARTQERIERAYVRVLTVVNEGWALMERARPDEPDPDFAAVDARVETVFAEMDAFGSDAVRDVFDRWRTEWLLFKIDLPNTRLRAGGGSPDRFDLKNLEELRKRAREAAKELILKVRLELRGEVTD